MSFLKPFPQADELGSASCLECGRVFSVAGGSLCDSCKDRNAPVFPFKLTLPWPRRKSIVFYNEPEDC